MIRNILLGCLAIMSVIIVKAQTTDFEKAYNACIRVNTAFNDGFAHEEQLSAAANTLRNLKIGALQLQLINGEKHSLNGHIVFTSNFILDCIDNESIYTMADKYAKLQQSYRGGNLFINTILLKSGASATYKIRNCRDYVYIGCVAEPNGLFSWKLKIEDAVTNVITKEIIDNIDEVKGRISRHQKIGGQYYHIIIEITNTSTTDSSFAIIVQ